MASAINLAGMSPSQYIHENTAAAVYYSVTQSLTPEYNENLLFVNIGQLGVKLSLINVKNHIDEEATKNRDIKLKRARKKKKEEEEEDVPSVPVTFPETTTLFDFFYNEFSGQ